MKDRMLEKVGSDGVAGTLVGNGYLRRKSVIRCKQLKKLDVKSRMHNIEALLYYGTEGVVGSHFLFFDEAH